MQYYCAWFEILGSIPDDIQSDEDKQCNDEILSWVQFTRRRQDKK